MAEISEDFPVRTIQSIRINDRLIDICKKTGLPLSTIVESGLIHFGTMSDKDRIDYLNKYNSDKIHSIELMEPQFNIAEEAVNKAKESLGKQAKGTSTKMLLAIGLGLLTAWIFTKDMKGGE